MELEKDQEINQEKDGNDIEKGKKEGRKEERDTKKETKDRHEDEK